jgi:hypothetical protein
MRFSETFLPTTVRERWRSMYDACGLRTCKNTVFMRSIQSRVGVTVGGQWYCGVDCFIAATKIRYSVMAAANVVDIRHMPRRPIGLLLLSKGFLTEEQLRYLTAESELRGEEFEQTLTRAGAVTDQQLATARAAQWGSHVLGPDQPILPVQTDIPLEVLRACAAVPLHDSKSSRRLIIGFVRNIDHSLLHSLEEVTGVRPEACLVTPAQFAKQRERLSASAESQCILLEDNCTPVQMANTTGRFAIDIGVRDARSTRCWNLIWTRLSGKQGFVDLLFRVGSIQPTISAGGWRWFEENARSLG